MKFGGNLYASIFVLKDVISTQYRGNRRKIKMITNTTYFIILPNIRLRFTVTPPYISVARKIRLYINTTTIIISIQTVVTAAPEPKLFDTNASR